MGKHILETVFGVITQITLMDWQVKGSASAGPVPAAQGSVHRAHTRGDAGPQPVAPVHPGVNQRADRTGHCIGHTE